MLDSLNIKNLPLIIIKYNTVLPFQMSKIHINSKWNSETIRVAISRYDGNVLCVLQKNKIYSKPNFDNIYDIGTLCKIRFKKGIDDKKNIEKIDENEFDIIFSGITRVKIKKILHLNKSNFAEYQELVDVYTDPKKELELFKNILDIVKVNFPDAIKGVTKLNTSELDISQHSVAGLLYSIVFAISKEANIYQSIMDENVLLKRLELVYTILVEKIKYLKHDSEINAKINESIAKAQKEFYLREKIKILREELGEKTSKSQEYEKINKILKEKKFPKNIHTKIKEELEKYDALPPMSAELGVIKNYIDWLVKLPWYEKSTDNNSLIDIQKILNKNHFGLKKVKDRIIEYLAVKIKNAKNKQSVILCLVGPPGVGKTSLGQSIAEALNRHFVKVSLGGVKDESEIRGHRRTYIGAMPGRIIQSMKRAEVINPLFLLDEIDKMASDYRGDPASALLEVLDPEQNTIFSDHYIEEPYDLSEVLFVTTANSILTIPEALKDRLEIIELHSYTELEKFKIAKDYLMPSVYEEHSLKKSQLSIPDSVLLYIIRKYTMEAGVRQLRREISKICRKTVVRTLVEKTNFKKITINKKNISSYLGVEKFNFDKANSKSEIGVVTGLAWTQYGGDILPIEVTKFTGRGKFEITGNLGDVMKESASISLSYIKTNLKFFGINIDMSNIDIHIHAPEGAIPKDGPSAGVTMVTAIVSLLKKFPISRKYAMTGEMTLQGNVLPIGGLKEKLISAVRSKIKTVFIPKENIRSLLDIPQEITSQLKIIAVSNYLQIYNYIFKKIDMPEIDITTIGSAEMPLLVDDASFSG